MRDNSDLQVYFAEGDFKGLSGYCGVIEGCYNYGVFKD